jgi:RNA polymerase sigma-70 factor, ECF subfamily
LSEYELLNKIKKNPDAFSEIFKLYYKQIFAYIFRRTGDFDITADIAADTFLKAFTHIDNFDYRGISVKVWLYRIATNEMNLFFRNRKKYTSLFERLHIENKEQFKNLLDKDKEELESEVERHDQYLKVLEALKTLPAKYQEVISLRYFEGLNNTEIAEILNKNEGTLKSLISRGLKKLRNECNQL